MHLFRPLSLNRKELYFDTYPYSDLLLYCLFNSSFDTFYFLMLVSHCQVSGRSTKATESGPASEHNLATDSRIASAFGPFGDPKTSQELARLFACCFFGVPLFSTNQANKIFFAGVLFNSSLKETHLMSPFKTTQTEQVPSRRTDPCQQTRHEVQFRQPSWVPFSGDLCGIFMDFALKSGRQTSPLLRKDHLKEFSDFVHLFAPLARWVFLLPLFRPQEVNHFLGRGSISAERSCEYPRARNEKIFNQKILLQLGDLRLGSRGKCMVLVKSVHFSV